MKHAIENVHVPWGDEYVPADIAQIENALANLKSRKGGVKLVFENGLALEIEQSRSWGRKILRRYTVHITTDISGIENREQIAFRFPYVYEAILDNIDENAFKLAYQLRESLGKSSEVVHVRRVTDLSADELRQVINTVGRAGSRHADLLRPDGVRATAVSRALQASS